MTRPLMLEWWDHTKDEYFIIKCLDILQPGKVDLVSWSDGQSLPGLHWWVSSFLDFRHPLKEEFLALIEQRLIAVLKSSVSIDELISIVESVYENMSDSTTDNISEVLEMAIGYEFEETAESIGNLDM